mmetsp:Transcript_28093/g.24054  ORF Transcript_28093/g.24054 Transcript_28093/m.24054 type:complete len:86 (-) Transcript_28093:11-268(-)
MKGTIKATERRAVIRKLPRMLLNWALTSGGVDRVEEWRCLIFFCVTSVVTIAIVPMFRMLTSKHPYMAEVLKIEQNRAKSSVMTP